MPGTSMPGWGDTLSDQDMWDVIAYIKIFAGLEEEVPTDQLDYGVRVETTDESTAKGKVLFEDRCSECHGMSGKGVATKKLKDDNGERTWPRNLTKPWTFRASNDPNLTKPWTFRASNDPKDVFTRISVGIAGTQMPSFDDPKSAKKLTIEERWHIANYVTSLAKTVQVVRPENTVVKADKVSGAVPEDPDDPRWAEAEPTTFLLVPQIIAKERFFTPANDTITVRAFYDDQALSVLLEWDDRTKSMPGDPKAEEIADPDMAEDSVALQLPVTIPRGMKKPYFGMGDPANPVNIWQWKSGSADETESVGYLNARGFEDVEERSADDVGLRATGSYDDGTWRVVMVRPLAAADPDKDIQFREGVFTPIAFAAWDGSNSETGTAHTLTTWYWLLLKPSTGLWPYGAALAVLILFGAGEFWWLRSATNRKRRSAT